MKKQILQTECLIYHSDPEPKFQGKILSKAVMLNDTVNYIVVVYNQDDVRIWTDYFPLSPEGRKEAMAFCRDVTTDRRSKK